MELLHESDFRRELREGPRTGYLLFGEEDYLKAHAVRTAEELICPDGPLSVFNVMRLDALDYTPARLTDALMALPMMTERKLVLLSGMNLGAMRPGEIEALCEVLAELPNYDYNLLLLKVPADGLDPGALPRRPSALLNRLAQHLTPVQFERCTPAKLASWAKKHFAHHGLEASPQFCARVVEYCGRSMYQLAQEIDKLSFYTLAQGKAAPDEEGLRLVCTPSAEYDTFAFANAVMEGSQQTALDILADYRFRRVEPLLILGDVIRIFCDMESVHAMQADGASTQEIASALRLHEFRVRLCQKSLRQSPPGRLRRALDACAAADAALKLSPQGYTALEKLICSI